MLSMLKVQRGYRVVRGGDMMSKNRLWVGAFVAVWLLSAGSGCCRFAERWCRDDNDRCYAPAYAPPQYAPQCGCGPGGGYLPPQQLPPPAAGYGGQQCR